MAFLYNKPNSSNQSKSFRQKYRVFSAAFWQNNGSSVNLERSDKVVLPASALTALTECNAQFPVLLKIEKMDQYSNRALPSSIFNYVIDYSAPEGLIYMSSWMITKLKLDQSGQSVVQLSVPTQSNYQYQCPPASFIRLQPHSLQLMILSNATDLVYKSLNECYSSVSVNDVITVYDDKNNKKYKLNVQEIKGKGLNYTPKCVRIDANNIDSNLMLGFDEPLDYNIEQLNDDKKDADDDCDHWEIVSVSKIRKIPDPIFEDDVIEEKGIENSGIGSGGSSDDVVIVESPNLNNIINWQCPKCKEFNAQTYKFCPKCGHKKVMASVPKNITQNKNENTSKLALNLPHLPLKRVSIINDGMYKPMEERQTGWILKNVSNDKLSFKGKLLRLNSNSNSDVVMTYDDVLEVNCSRKNEEIFILVSVKAGVNPTQTHAFFQFVYCDDENQRICDVLTLPVIVKSEFTKENEAKIKQIIEMGWEDRNKAVKALKKWNWDQLKAINWLATH